MREFIVQVAGIAYTTNAQYGDFSKGLITKLIDIYKRFDNQNRKTNLLESLQRIENATDEDIDRIIAYERSDPTSALEIGKLSLPYLESKIPELGYFRKSCKGSI